jgi:aspartate dehydrogenase
MPCSVSALADDGLKNSLLEAARKANTRIFIPHGAAVGMDNLAEAKEKWKQVTITFRKPAASIDGYDGSSEGETILFDGSIREIAEKFPRSVNSMVACALATIGLDQSRARMIADGRLDNVLKGEFEFVAHDGSKLTITKEEPAVGVSSTGMIHSLVGSVKRALGANSDTLSFV